MDTPTTQARSSQNGNVSVCAGVTDAVTGFGAPMLMVRATVARKPVERRGGRLSAMPDVGCSDRGQREVGPRETGDMEVKAFGPLNALWLSIYDVYGWKAAADFSEYLDFYYYNHLFTFTKKQIFRHFTIRGGLVKPFALFEGLCATPPGGYYSVPQSGLDAEAKAKARAEREDAQRLAAKLRAKAYRKEKPKQQREREVRAERRAQFNLMSQIPAEEQGFVDCAVAAAAGGAIVGLSHLAHRITKKAEKSADAVSDLMAQVKRRLEEFAEWCKKTVGDIWLVPVVLLAHCVLSSVFHIPLVATLAAAMLAKMLGEKAWSIVAGYFKPVEQSGDTIADIGSLLCALVCTVAIPTKNASFALGELLKRMGTFKRGKEGFEAFFKMALKYAEKAVNTLLSLFSNKSVSWMDESERLVDAFCSKVDNFEKRAKSTTDVMPIEYLLETVDSQLEAIGLKATVRDPALRMRVDRYLSRLSVLLIPYQSAITSARNYRPEPTFVCFYGESAMGKTTLVTKFACAILVRTGLVKPETALRNLWQKGTTEYWNGYVNQKCLIMDDCFQIKPVKGKDDNEYMNVIRMVGNWAYALNFADLESKGKFYFDTPLIIGTTNCACIANEAGQLINQPEAVVRRIKHPYRIEVNKDYQTEFGRLDYDRVEREFNDNLNHLRKTCSEDPDAFFSAYPWEAWNLVRHDFTNPQNAGPYKSVRELIDDIVSNIRESGKRHTEAVKNLEFFLEGLAKPPIDKGEKTTAETEPKGKVVPVTEVPGSSLVLFPSPTEIEPFEATEQSGLTSFADLDPSRLETFAELEERKRLERPEFPLYGEDAHGSAMTFLPPVKEGRSFKEMCVEVRNAVYSWFARFKAKSPIFLGVASVGAIFAFGPTILSVLAAVAKGAYEVGAKLVNMVTGRGVPRKAKNQSNIKTDVPAPKGSFRSPKVEIQSTSLPDIIHDKIYQNTFSMSLVTEDGDVLVGQVQFVESTVAFQPAHFTVQMQERLAAGTTKLTDKVLLCKATTEFKLELTVKQWLEIPRAKVADRDVEFLNFPPGTLQCNKKITQYFLTDSQYADAIKSAAAVRLDVCKVETLSGKRVLTRHTLGANSFEYMRKLTTGKAVYEDLLGYNMNTEVGMCGAPLTIAVNRHYGGRCYLGLHTAGSPGYLSRKGFCTIVTAQMVEQAVNGFKAVRDNFAEDMEARGVPVVDLNYREESGLVGDDKLIKGSFTLIGMVSKPVSMSPNTKLKPSPIGELEVFGPNPQKPAHMKPFFDAEGNYISPIVEGLRAYASDLEYREVPNIHAIVALATKPFRTASVSDTRHIFSFEEAVVGVEGLKIKSVSRATSPGYPYVLDTKGGKKAFFGADDEFDLTSDLCRELEQRVEYIIDSARKGTRLAHVFIDFLKDETRPIAKVDSGATRIISAAPLDYVVAFRRYFGAFMAAMFRHHTVSGMCPGINPYSEWWVLASKLSSRGDKVFDGDFKRFDSSEQPYLHEVILEFINQWYNDGEENALIRKVLWLELVHSRHLSGDSRNQCYLVQWNKSLPSGHPFTTPVNSLYSLITLTGCYTHLTGDYVNMWNKVYLGTFGDDNIVNTGDAVSEVFNQVTVASTMKELFGLTYTAGSKDGELTPYTTLDKCTFLKRRFVPDVLAGGGWVAPLEPSSFLFVPYYYKNNKDMAGEIFRNMENLLGELALHDQALWDEHYPIVARIMADAQKAPDHGDRKGYRQMMQARVDAWF